MTRIGLLDGDAADRPQPFCTFRVARRKINPCFCTLQLSRAVAQLDLVRLRVDYKQQVALLDDIAVLETDLSQRPTDLGAQLHPFHARKLTQELQPRGDITLERRTDGDRRKGSRG